MKLLDFDCDDGKNMVVLEMKNSEISTICYHLESLVILSGKLEDNKIIQELHDSLLRVISIPPI